MRITILCHDIPFPPNHGGRVDMWRRILAFSELGAQLQIISWSYEAPEEFVVDELKRHAASVIQLPIERNLSYRIRRVPHIFEASLYAGLRWPSALSLQETTRAVDQFRPDCVWLDGFHGGLLALYLKDHCGVPFFYRSQNVEHVYLEKLRKSSASIRSWLAFAVGQIGIESFEERLINAAVCTYDISLDDMEYWRNRCRSVFRWLPPLIDWSTIKNQDAIREKFDFDVLFLGNLNTENNITGLRWFLEKVAPYVLREVPECVIGVAGSNPSRQVTEMCEKIRQVRLLSNPSEINSLLVGARVLINPMLGGSGVKLKSLDMLSSGRPVVSTSEGITGLPSEARKFFCVSDAPDDFAAAIVGYIRGDEWKPPDFRWLNGQFGLGKIQSLLSEMACFLGEASTPRIH